MDHGSLHDLLHDGTVILDAEIIVPIIRDISKDMRFLHSAHPRVIHGDLKAANISVDSRFRGKVADFGLSQKTELRGTGSPFWMAQELLRRECSNTPATDIHSFGIILHEVHSRKDPCEEEDPREVLCFGSDRAVSKRPPIPNALPTAVQSLMSDCLEDQIEKQPDCEELDVQVHRIEVEPSPNEMNKTVVSLFDLFPQHVAKALRDGCSVEAGKHTQVMGIAV